MIASQNISRQDLLSELQLRHQEVLKLKKRLTSIEQTADNQKFTDIIIDNSPAILFRRLASEDVKKRKMVYVSPNISRFGYKAEDFISNRIMFSHIVNPADKPQIRREIQEYVSSNIDNYSQTYRIITKDGDLRWVEDHTSVIDDPESGNRYHQGIVTDIHERKEAEEKLRKSEEKHRRILETTVEGFLFMDKDLFIVDVNNAFSGMVQLSREELLGRNLVDLVTDKYRPLLSANRDDFLQLKHYEFESDLLESTGMAVPVLIHGNSLLDDGGIVIGNIAFVTDMREHKKALILAAEVQKNLLPQKAPKIQGLDISGKNISCDEIGGDYYDFLMHAGAQNDRLSVVVGDFSGHGVDSALLMTTARAFLRMRSSQPGTINDIVTDMNRHLSEDILDSGKFMTLFYLSIDVKKKCIEWIRAGHEPAWLYDPDDDAFHELKGQGVALGIDDEYEYRSSSKTGLKPGQVLIVGTDGIWEGHNRSGEMFGKLRFQEVVRNNARAVAENILDSVFSEQRVFTQDTRTEDDLTLVIIKITR